MRWTAEGFLIPLAIYALVWLVAGIWSLLEGGAPFYEDAIKTGGMFATLGFFLTGGSMVLTWIFSTGARWSTVFRIAGFTAAMITQWNITDWLMAQW